MKLIYRWTYYVWMLCLLFSSCRSDKDYPEAMQKAIACMESHPDSAQIYLASLDSVIADEPEETRMYHALLTTQANDKLYITHTSDSVMQQVVRFY
ncbi:MAG: tetratricopeptide repeat protein, partial [Parabacteroides sp.]|nr:tetratricopeptide repeat protein [Parabacteroides sp.]